MIGVAGFEVGNFHCCLFLNTVRLPDVLTKKTWSVKRMQGYLGIAVGKSEETALICCKSALNAIR